MPGEGLGLGRWGGDGLGDLGAGLGLGTMIGDGDGVSSGEGLAPLPVLPYPPGLPGVPWPPFPELSPSFSPTGGEGLMGAGDSTGLGLGEGALPSSSGTQRSVRVAVMASVPLPTATRTW